MLCLCWRSHAEPTAAGIQGRATASTRLLCLRCNTQHTQASSAEPLLHHTRREPRAGRAKPGRIRRSRRAASGEASHTFQIQLQCRPRAQNRSLRWHTTKARCRPACRRWSTRRAEAGAPRGHCSLPCCRRWSSSRTSGEAALAMRSIMTWAAASAVSSNCTVTGSASIAPNVSCVPGANM